jgi:Uma2 family endonuclease
MTALPKLGHVSVEEYLEGETLAETKHEYVGGTIYAMAGATNRHNRITTNAIVFLGLGLRGKPCEVFNSDTKVRIELSNQTRFYYPDALVVCDLNSANDHFQERPVMIVEVLSESTRRIDLGEKRDAYLAIPTLKLLLLVEPDLAAVALYRRGPAGGFLLEEYSGLDAVVDFPEIGVTLSLADLYEGAHFPVA